MTGTRASVGGRRGGYRQVHVPTLLRGDGGTDPSRRTLSFSSLPRASSDASRRPQTTGRTTERYLKVSLSYHIHGPPAPLVRPPDLPVTYPGGELGRGRGFERPPQGDPLRAQSTLFIALPIRAGSTKGIPRAWPDTPTAPALPGPCWRHAADRTYPHVHLDPLWSERRVCSEGPPHLPTTRARPHSRAPRRTGAWGFRRGG